MPEHTEILSPKGVTFTGPSARPWLGNADNLLNFDQTGIAYSDSFSSIEQVYGIFRFDFQSDAIEQYEWDSLLAQVRIFCRTQVATGNFSAGDGFRFDAFARSINLSLLGATISSAVDDTDGSYAQHEHYVPNGETPAFSASLIQGAPAILRSRFKEGILLSLRPLGLWSTLAVQFNLYHVQLVLKFLGFRLRSGVYVPHRRLVSVPRVIGLDLEDDETA